MDLTDADYAIIRQVAESVGRARWIPRDDLEQEAAIRLWHCAFDQPQSNRNGFVAVVAKRAMLDWLRTFRGKPLGTTRRTHYVCMSDLAGVTYEESWSAIDALLDNPTNLRRALRCVPKRARRLLWLHFIHGLTTADVEKRLGLAPQTYHYFLRETPKPARQVVKIHKKKYAVDLSVRRPWPKTPDELRSIIQDIPAFLESLPPAPRADTTAWLSGMSIEDIARLARVKPATVKNSIGKAISRARFAAEQVRATPNSEA